MFSNLLFVCIKVMTWLALRATLYQNSWTLKIEILISICCNHIHDLFIDLLSGSYLQKYKHACNTCSFKAITRLFLILAQLSAISFIANSGDVMKTRNRKGVEMLHSSSNY